MSNQNLAVLSLSLKLTGTVTNNRFVTPAGVQAGAGANTLGVSRQSGVAGDMAAIDVLGTATLESGGAVAAGATIASDATGRAVTWASGAKVALALEAATAAGQAIEVLLIPNVA
ncbi:capsid cement protein [Dechloromonas sp. CZR5]|uniref:capsid cement protein n=1 Tax=Dechloromonas sp. CZR5 TaxID=2608630 RepID=UPI00123E4574|nr:capsid cement protein [Dechloromonas sp. CZR5]